MKSTAIKSGAAVPINETIDGGKQKYGASVALFVWTLKRLTFNINYGPLYLNN